MPVKKTCVVCGTIFKVPPSRAKSAKACSNECAISVRAKSRERKVEKGCLNCGKIFEVPQSHKDRRKYCSKKCKYTGDLFLEQMRNSMVGEKNPMWGGGETEHSAGYVYQYSPDHPFSSNNYVLKHRLVMEEMLKRDNPHSIFLTEIDGKEYLDPSFVVHHLDWENSDRKENREDNLIVLTSSCHGRIHNHNPIPKNAYWPPTAVIKYGKKDSVLK